ncbi:MAG: aminoacyl-tRNA hydrolase [Proteobacteria bacterium]|nr:aminoacyl-tRNA hydrolase [Pseudomonadota bacterium]
MILLKPVTRNKTGSVLTQDLFLIAGLGNPGSKYSKTRHNAGFWFINTLANKAGVSSREQGKLHAQTVRTSLSGRDCLLMQPTTFMNESGIALRSVVDYYKIKPGNMLVAYDELDLEPGDIRLKQGGGHGGHNGLRDIFRHLGRQDFLRLRIGIGHPGQKDRVTPWVLGRPTLDQEIEIQRSLEQAELALPAILEGRVNEAMTQLHTRS